MQTIKQSEHKIKITTFNKNICMRSSLIWSKLKEEIIVGI